MQEVEGGNQSFGEEKAYPQKLITLSLLPKQVIEQIFDPRPEDLCMVGRRQLESVLNILQT